MFEFAKLVIILSVPAWLVYTNKRRLALIWLGVTLPMDALSSNVIVRVTCISAFGLVSAPYVLWMLGKRLRELTKAEALAVAICLIMAAGMVYHGFLSPWPDPSGERPWNQAAAGRSLIFTVRYMGEMCAALYVGYAIGHLKRPRWLLDYMLMGTIIVAASVLFQLVTGVDPFFRLSTFSQLDITAIGRARGLCYEPRAAAQWCATGILLCVGLGNLGKLRWPLVGYHLAGLAATLSTSGMIVLAAGLTTMALLAQRARKAWFAVAAACIMVVIAGSSMPSIRNYVDTYNELMEKRLEYEHEDQPTGLFDRMRYKMEVFDGAAVGFLAAHPEYLPLGTGAGVISIPSSDYMRAVDRRIYGDRIDSLPHGGLVNIVSNTGLLGLTVWLMLVGASLRAIVRVYTKTSVREWRDTYVLFAAFCVYFLVMMREMWFPALGLGIGAALIAQDWARSGSGLPEG